VLLDGRFGAWELFDIGGDYDRREAAEVFEPPPLAPGQEAADVAGVGLAGVGVAEVAVKNSTKRQAVRSPAVAISAGRPPGSDNTAGTRVVRSGVIRPRPSGVG
jgi:hypothetical protein